MNFITNTLFYLLLLVFDVKTIVNETEKLESCVTGVGTSLTESNESNKNLLSLIDQSTVILKAFCSENLINFAEENDDEFRMNVGKKSSRERNDVNDSENEDDDGNYDDYYFYKSDDDKNLKILMTFTPITVFKGTNILRQLELFSNQEYFLIKGQLNATLELGKDEKILYQQKCYSDSKINDQGQMLNKNHLIEKQIRNLVPGQLIMFGKLDKSNGQSKNRFAVKTNGIVRWSPHVENFVWNNLGWSSWSKWSPCSKPCRGIQQRYRHCLTTQRNKTAPNDNEANEMDKSESATTARQPNQQLCNGYNIEQRECNLFECKDAVNLLSWVNNTKTSVAELSAHINQVVDKNDFTIMFTIRSKVSNYSPLYSNQHLVSLRSDNNKQTSLTISLIETGIKVVQEKDAGSEMFDIKFNLFDVHWHQVALSFRNDGLITCYVDCIWDSSFVMSRGSFEIPQRARVDINTKLSGLIEWKQLNLISGNHERAQCSNDRTPIYDNNKLLEKMFDDEAN